LYFKLKIQPKSPVIQLCELKGRPVVEYAPDSKEAEIFRKLATEIMENDSRVIPTPINDLVELETMFRQHLERNKNWENEDDQSFVERTNSLFHEIYKNDLAFDL